MSLAQQLLVRAILARLWRAPIDGPLPRWGSSLHDRFMLGHYVWEDFLDVLADLKSHGFAFRSDWYEAQAEFRFPFCGEVEYEGGEAGNPPGARAVARARRDRGDRRHRALTNSSTERVQVKLATADPERYVVACNRRRVPCARRRPRGLRSGAVRYKAWQPAIAMHPVVSVHAPLVFDIFDKWSGRALGGCVYHVAHPGGRGYDTFPVNSNEAKARRLARFEARGHSPGAYEPPPETTHPEFPLTLDLQATGRGLERSAIGPSRFRKGAEDYRADGPRTRGVVNLAVLALAGPRSGRVNSRGHTSGRVTRAARTMRARG